MGNRHSTDDRTARRRRTRDDRIRVVVGVLLVVLAVITAAASFRANTQLAAVSDCQSDANKAFARALQLRSDAQHATNDAQRQFLNSLGPTSTQAQRTAAMATYLAALDQLDATQAANPLVVKDCPAR